MIRLRLYLLLINFLALSASAQTEADTVARNRKPQFRIGVFYNSYLHYYGRTDSLQSSGIFLLAEVWLGKHFYMSAAPIFITGKGQGPSYTGSVLMTGYRFGKENKAIGHIYGIRPVYQQDATLVQSALKAQFGGTGTIFSKVLNVSAGVDVKWSDELDFSAQAGVDYIFRRKLGKSTILAADPTVYVNAGTQRFTRTYIKQSGFLFFSGPQQQVTERVSEFNILSYELSVPIILQRGKMQLIVSPAFVIPKNKIGEMGEDKFYGLLGARLTL